MEQPGLRDGVRPRGQHAGRERDSAGERGDALRVPPGVGVLGLERVGEPEQALEDRVLEPAVRLAQVDRILARLRVGVPQPVLGLLELPLARARGLVERLEIACVGQRLREGYTAGHIDTSGMSDRTSVSRASGENGLVR